ncbi:MAG: hypothetical protein ACI9AX_002676 [Polaromonas sp.]
MSGTADLGESLAKACFPPLKSKCSRFSTRHKGLDADHHRLTCPTSIASPSQSSGTWSRVVTGPTRAAKLLSSQTTRWTDCSRSKQKTSLDHAERRSKTCALISHHRTKCLLGMAAQANHYRWGNYWLGLPSSNNLGQFRPKPCPELPYNRGRG